MNPTEMITHILLDEYIIHNLFIGEKKVANLYNTPANIKIRCQYLC